MEGFSGEVVWTCCFGFAGWEEGEELGMNIFGLIEKVFGLMEGGVERGR